MEECVNLVDDQTYDKSPSYIKKNTSNGYPCPRILVACRISRQRRTAYYAKAAYWANEVKKSNKHKMNPDIYAIWKNMAADKYDTEYNESIWEAEFIR